jgi:hypothetical protein
MSDGVHTWQRPEQCPFCEQGSALSLDRCPGCIELSIICEEAGCVFPDPTNLANGTFGGYFESGAKCPHCQRTPIQDLVAATLEQIEASGMKLGSLERYDQGEV